MVLVLNNEEPVSYNRLLRLNPHARNREAQTRKLLVREALPAQYSLYEVQVDIAIIAYFKKQMQDNCNITAKLYIDGLLGLVIVDDSPRYVRSVMTISRHDPDRPRVEIYLAKVNEEKIEWLI